MVDINVLTDPLFDAGLTERLSLPGVFARSAAGADLRFARVRPHQRAAWHTFRVQLAALAFARGGVMEPPTDEVAWADLLRALTDDEDGPWALVGPRDKPALLQPPDPGGLRWEPVLTPDALDLLSTAKNHDLKAQLAEEARPEDWVYGLLTLQTFEGYNGRGRFGIARMNGGSSSRPFLGLAPAPDGRTPDAASWWRRDLKVLLTSQNEPTPLTRGGPALLWCHPWPEGEAIPAHTLDPWAIEVCRRVRLVGGERLSAERAGSKAARVASSFNGAMGDSWAPVTKSDETPKALTLAAGRFDYRRIRDLLLSGNWTVPLAARVRPDEQAGDAVIVAEALSRTNKTDGFKTRTIPVPQRIQNFVASEPERVAQAAQDQITIIDEADAALREAVALYAAGGRREAVKQDQRRRAATARQRLDAFADAIFFEHLWARVDPATAPDLTPERFNERLAEKARAELTHAYGAIPCPTLQEPRARVRSEALLNGKLRRAGLLPELVLDPTDAPGVDEPLDPERADAPELPFEWPDD